MKKNLQKIKRMGKSRRRARTRSKIFGTAGLPRLNVSKSLNHIFLQLIDDEAQKTLVSLHSKALGLKKRTKIEAAKEAGLAFAKKAIAAKHKQCVFDRGSARYHGRVRAVAEGLRAGGIKF